MNDTNRCPACATENKPGAAFCSRCGAQLEQPRPQAPLSRTPVARRTKLLYAAFALLLVGIMVVLLVRHLPGGAHPVIEGQPVVAMASAFTGQQREPAPVESRIAGGNIIISLPEVLDKKIVEFDYDNQTTVIPLLAFITPEGKLVTAIRICEPCNSKKYSIDGDELCCGNCETRWKLTNLEGIQGSCQKYPPDPIPSTVEGNTILIKESLVKNWKMRI